MNGGRSHLPEYGIEAALLAIFMLSAVGFSIALFHPDSPFLVEAPLLARFLMGLAMGGTAAALIYSPFGKRSGAHFNPAVTLTFLRLGRIRGRDALGYVVAQFLGGALGVYVARAAFGALVTAPQVDHAVTRPGPSGLALAFVAEVVISFLLMSVVLFSSCHRRLETRTGLLAATLVCLYITFEAPLSGMSMNPARSFGSALVAFEFQDLWIYFLAPPLGMWLAAETARSVLPKGAVLCAKLHHRNEEPCIFVCDYDPSRLLGAGGRP